MQGTPTLVKRKPNIDSFSLKSEILCPINKFYFDGHLSRKSKNIHEIFP